MDMEIQFLHEAFPGKGPKLLADHIRRMGSGEAPFYSMTLSLVYDRLAEKTVAPSVPSGPISLPKFDAVLGTDLPRAQTSFSFDWFSGTTSSGPRPPVPTPAPISRPDPPEGPSAWLVCSKCGEPASLGELYDGLKCPRCPPRGGRGKRPYMICQLCGGSRAKQNDNCSRKVCQAKFR